MAQWRRHPRLWLALALVMVLVAAGALWLRGTQTGSDDSPLPASVAPGASPLSTPVPVVSDSVASPSPSSWTNGSAFLLWVALGILLALGIAIFILRWYRRSV